MVKVFSLSFELTITQNLVKILSPTPWLEIMPSPFATPVDPNWYSNIMCYKSVAIWTDVFVVQNVDHLGIICNGP